MMHMRMMTTVAEVKELAAGGEYHNDTGPVTDPNEECVASQLRGPGARARVAAPRARARPGIRARRTQCGVCSVFCECAPGDRPRCPSRGM